jgi:hypothetical protein
MLRMNKTKLAFVMPAYSFRSRLGEGGVEKGETSLKFEKGVCQCHFPSEIQATPACQK